jgi:hypothetical protein
MLEGIYSLYYVLSVVVCSNASCMCYIGTLEELYLVIRSHK